MSLSRRSLAVFKKAVFPTIVSTLQPNEEGHVVRIHSSEGSVQFSKLARGDELKVVRYLEMDTMNCHAVVSEHDFVDIFMDVETASATWTAAQVVLKHIIDALKAELEKANITDDKIKNILVLNASGRSREKQSFHIHVRLDKPLASRRDVKALLLCVKKAVPSAVASWLDVQPAVSGSLRIMNSTTTSRTRPLKILNYDSLSDKSFSAYLREKAPKTKALQAEMTFIKRFGSQGPAYTFTPPPSTLSAKPKNKAEFLRETKGFDLDQLIESGALRRLVSEISPEQADNWESWIKVMFALKTLASHSPEHDAELYSMFDDFSSQSFSKYTPLQNARQWEKHKPKEMNEKVSWYTLKQMAKKG